VDAFQGTVTHTLSDFENNKAIPLNPTFSPDSKYILCGSTNQYIHCWSRETGRLVAKLKTEHTNPIENVLFNPKYYMMASACTQLKFWIPSDEEEGNDPDARGNKSPNKIFGR